MFMNQEVEKNLKINSYYNGIFVLEKRFFLKESFPYKAGTRNKNVETLQFRKNNFLYITLVRKLTINNRKSQIISKFFIYNFGAKINNK